MSFCLWARATGFDLLVELSVALVDEGSRSTDFSRRSPNKILLNNFKCS